MGWQLLHHTQIAWYRASRLYVYCEKSHDENEKIYVRPSPITAVARGIYHFPRNIRGVDFRRAAKGFKRRPTRLAATAGDLILSRKVLSKCTNTALSVPWYRFPCRLANSFKNNLNMFEMQIVCATIVRCFTSVTNVIVTILYRDEPQGRMRSPIVPSEE